MNVEVRHLRAFLAIVEERTFTGAAQRLGIGQSAQFRTLAQLESRLGVRLIDCTIRRLGLTRAGLVVLPWRLPEPSVDRRGMDGPMRLTFVTLIR